MITFFNFSPALKTDANFKSEKILCEIDTVLKIDLIKGIKMNYCTIIHY